MNSKQGLFFIAFLTFNITACNATRAPAYEANKPPEERTMYTGYEGWMQRLDDQKQIQDQAIISSCRGLYIEYQTLKVDNDPAKKRSLRNFQRRCPESVRSGIQ